MCLSQEEDSKAMRLLGEELLDVDTLLHAIKALWDELPSLVGEEWKKLEIRLKLLFEGLKETEPQYIPTVRDILTLLKNYPCAYKRVVERGLIEKAKSGRRCVVARVTDFIDPDVVPCETVSPATDSVLETVKEAREAFDRLFEAYREAVKGRIRSYLCPVQRNNDLEDLVQGTALEAFERICTYNPDRASFYTWLLIWARYVVQRYFEKKRQHIEREIVVSDLVAQLRAQASKGEISEDIAEALIETLAVAPLTRLELSPDTVAEILDKFRHFLSITFSEGGYPHQQIAFGFIQLLGWTPKEIVNELSGVPLKDLAQKLEDDYVRTLEYARKEARKCFQPLHQKMKCKLRGVIPEGDDSWEIITSPRDAIVGETKLPDYWGDRPTDNLSNWCYRVKQRVVRIMVERKLDC